MKEHFEEHLNLRNLILTERPRHVLECGALDGDTTNLLIGLIPIVGFKLTVISDDADTSLSNGVTYLKGVSYEKFESLDNDSIDLCIIDTDHNYFTISKELYAIYKKLRVGGLIVIHDVDTFYYDTGMADFYADGSMYPKIEILSLGQTNGSLGTGVIDFLSNNKFTYKLIRWLPESNGICVLRKNKPNFEISLLRPGFLNSGKRKGIVQP